MEHSWKGEDDMHHSQVYLPTISRNFYYKFTESCENEQSEIISPHYATHENPVVVKLSTDCR